MGIIMIDAGGLDPRNYAVVKACGRERHIVMIVRSAAGAHSLARHFMKRLSPAERRDGWTYQAEATNEPISYRGQPSSHGRCIKKADVLPFPAA
jgi:hypothetical protein